jgi:hypothetical protein
MENKHAAKSLEEHKTWQRDDDTYREKIDNEMNRLLSKIGWMGSLQNYLVNNYTEPIAFVLDQEDMQEMLEGMKNGEFKIDSRLESIMKRDLRDIYDPIRNDETG